MSATGTARREDHRPELRPRVAPTLRRALLLAVVYAVVAPGGEVVSGVDSDELNESTANALGIVVPVGLAILAVLAIAGRWSWPNVFRERRELRLAGSRRLWLVPGLFVLVIVLAAATAPWSSWSAGTVVMLLVATLLIGVGEELVARGFLLVGARTRYSEAVACLFTCGVFGLVHGVNVITGQALGATLGQIAFAAILGGGFYLLRRMSGLLVVPMVVHGLFDFAYYLQAPSEPEDDAGSALLGLPMAVLVLAIIATLIVVLRRESAGRRVEPRP